MHGLVGEHEHGVTTCGAGAKGLEILSCGANWHGQLGQSKSARAKEKGGRSAAVAVALPDGDEPPRQVACGSSFSVALTSSGRVYTWGMGKQGQLGCRIGLVSWHQPHPLLVEGELSSVQVVAIDCGQEHALALSSAGDIYSWGSNKYGQLGHGDHQLHPEPRRLTAEGATSFSHIAAGDKHSAALVGGKLYTWGSGACGQLGHGQLPARGSEVPHLPRPTVVNYADAKQMPSFRSVACGAACTVVTTEDEVYLCGSVAPRASIVVPPGATAPGVAGTMFDHLERLEVPATDTGAVAAKDGVCQVACGKSHLLLLTRCGDVYSMGAGDHGQLGHGKFSDLRFPQLVLQGKNIVHVSAGRYHSVALNAHGAAFTWGSAEHGALCEGNSDDGSDIAIPRLADSLMHRVLLQSACGDHHTLFLSTAPLEGSPDQLLSSELVAWQQAEHEDYKTKRATVVTPSDHIDAVLWQRSRPRGQANPGAQDAPAGAHAPTPAEEVALVEQALETTQLREEYKAKLRALSLDKAFKCDGSEGQVKKHDDILKLLKAR